MSQSQEHFGHHHHSHPSWQQTEHSIEHKLKHGAPVNETVYHEVHKLLDAEHHQRGFSQAKFERDVSHIEHELHKKHLLPHLHIASDQEHAGELYRGHHKPGSHHGGHDHGHGNEHGHGHGHGHEHGNEHGHGNGHEHAHGHGHEHGHSHGHDHTPQTPGRHQAAPTTHDGHPQTGLPTARPPQETYHPGNSGQPTVPPEVYHPSPSQPPQAPPESYYPPQQPTDVAPVSPGPGTDQIPQTNNPSDQAPVTGQGTSLEQAVQRAANGGRPLTITQIGDSHIAFGTETPAIAQSLAGDLGLKSGQYQSTFYGDSGKTAVYADDHADQFLKNVNANTDVVLVSFGSNEATGSYANYGAKYQDLINKIRQKAPNATIVMVGPTDGNFWNTNRELTHLNQVIDAQKAVAANTPNSLYIDVMGRMGSVAQLRQEGYMLSDNLHLTTKGYQALGQLIAGDMAQATH